jgi:hypothetical protein
MRIRILLVLGGALLTLAGYLFGSRNATVAYAHGTPPTMQYSGTPSHPVETPTQGTVPKSYGRIAAAIPDQIGTGLIFEDKEGVIRFVSMTGMKEGELARYDKAPTHGGIPKSYGHLVSAVVSSAGTGLIFEDAQGVIRFLTITGKEEGELTRE